MTERHLDPSVRHDFVLLFDVTDGNPNGDPDAGNLPRVDPETMQGMVTDVCLKRKVRDYVGMQRQGKPGYNIYVEHGGFLPRQREQAYTGHGLHNQGKKQSSSEVDIARTWMCANFYDVRTFGAVMGMNQYNCGQVRGPLQLTFARSVDPVVPLDLSITRVAIESTEEMTQSDEEGATHGTMGRKALLPYGLYRAHGFYNPYLAQDTGFTGDDLAVFWEALEHMWDLDRSAARGLMACRGLAVFSHDSALGNAPAHKLFDLVKVEKRDTVGAPRRFSDYEIALDRERVPTNVTACVLVEW